MLSPHETPLERDKVMSLLSAARSGAAVVVKAQYSPDPQKVERTLVFAEQGQRLIKLADAWLAPETYNEMISQLPDVSLGSCAAMYSTKPAYVWALRRDELRLWHSGFACGPVYYPRVPCKGHPHRYLVAVSKRGFCFRPCISVQDMGTAWREPRNEIGPERRYREGQGSYGPHRPRIRRH